MSEYAGTDVDVPAVLSPWPQLLGDLSAAGLPLNAYPPANVNALRVASGQCQVLGFTGFNAGAAGFIQWHDAGQLPIDGIAPAGFMAVPGVSNFAIDWGQVGRHFAQGCILVYSSTGPTKTIGTASCWFDAQYV